MPIRTARLYYVASPLATYQNVKRVPLIIYQDPPVNKDWSDLNFARNLSDENNVRHRKVHCTGDGASQVDWIQNLYPTLQSVATTTCAGYGNSEIHVRFFRDGLNLVEEYLWTYSPPGSSPMQGGRTVYRPMSNSFSTNWIRMDQYTLTQTNTPNWDFSTAKATLNSSQECSLECLCYWGTACVMTISTADLNCRQIFDSLDIKHALPSGIKSQAFRNATDTLRLTSGNVANVADLISIATAIVASGPFGAISKVDKEVKALSLGSKLAPTIIREISHNCPGMAAKALLKNQWLKKIADSWLWYRYAYTTTKSDVEEIHNKCKRLNISDQGWHTVRSAITVPTGQFHCKASIWKRNSDPASELAIRLHEYGLQVDPYVLWDLVPLSFVVDWFTDIGSRLEDKSSNWLTTSAVFDIPSIVYSWKYREKLVIGLTEYEFVSYSRWEEYSSPQFEYYKEDTSLKTVIYRILDGNALTLTTIRRHMT